MLDVVGAVIVGSVDQRPAVLAFRRRPGKSAAGRWEFPGGKVEPGESHASALTRELVEELNICARVGRLAGRSAVEVNGTRISLSCYFIDTACIPQVSSDHDRIEWVTADLARELEWADPDVPIVERLFDGSYGSSARGEKEGECNG